LWLSSKEAATYDTKHEKTLDKVIEEIRARRDFIGVDWVDDDDDESDHDGEAVQQKSVRLLDYACGTGTGRFAPFLTHPLPPFQPGHLFSFVGSEELGNRQSRPWDVFFLVLPRYKYQF
jgi:hypothetical protein